MKVVLQLPVRVNKDVVRIFRRRDVELQCPPFPGMGLYGLQLPHVIEGVTHVATQVLEVSEDLDGKRVFVTVRGYQDLTMTAEEILADLGEGWELIPLEPTTAKSPPKAGPPDTSKHSDW